MVGRKLLVLLTCMFLGLAASAQADTIRNQDQDSIIKAKVAIDRAAMELYFERRARAQYIRDSILAKKTPKVLTEAIDNRKRPIITKP